MKSTTSAGALNQRAELFHPTSTYGRDLAITGFFAAVNPTDGAVAMVPLAPLMTMAERKTFHRFAASGDPTAVRAILKVSYPDFGVGSVTTAQLRSLVSDWKSASAELSEDDAQFLRVVFFDSEGELRAELLERGIEMPYCDFDTYCMSVATYLIEFGGRFDNEAVWETKFFHGLLDEHHRAKDPSSVPASKIMDSIIRGGCWVA